VSALCSKTVTIGSTTVCNINGANDLCDLSMNNIYTGPPNYDHLLMVGNSRTFYHWTNHNFCSKSFGSNIRTSNANIECDRCRRLCKPVY
jgi:hypothetical protein